MCFYSLLGCRTYIYVFHFNMSELGCTPPPKRDCSMQYVPSKVLVDDAYEANTCTQMVLYCQWHGVAVYL